MKELELFPDPLANFTETVSVSRAIARLTEFKSQGCLVTGMRVLKHNSGYELEVVPAERARLYRGFTPPV